MSFKYNIILKKEIAYVITVNKFNQALEIPLGKALKVFENKN